MRVFPFRPSASILAASLLLALLGACQWVFPYSGGPAADQGLAEQGPAELGPRHEGLRPDITPLTCQPPDRLCRSGFCWERPLPQGSTLRAVLAISSGEAFFTGVGGTILHWTAAGGSTYQGWSTFETATSEILKAIWQHQPGDILVAGDRGVVLRGRGGTWTPVGPPGRVRPIDGLWGFQNQVWVAGGAGYVQMGTVSSSGVTWESDLKVVEEVPELETISGTSPDDIFVAGTAALLHFTGGAWRKAKLPSGYEYIPGQKEHEFEGVWAYDSGKAFVADSYDEDPHSFGNMLDCSSSPTATTCTEVYQGDHRLRAVAGSVVDKYALAVGAGGTILRRELAAGSTWMTLVHTVSRRTLHAVSTAGTIAFIAGEGATALRYAQQSLQAIGAPSSARALNAIQTDGEAVLAVGEGGLVVTRSVDTTWPPKLDLPQPIKVDLHGISGRYVVGGASTILDMQSEWARMVVPPPVAPLTPPAFNAVWADPGGFAVVVGDAGTLLELRNGSWQPAGPSIPSPINLKAVHGSGPDNVMAVGSSGIIMRWNGTSWQSMTDSPIGTAVDLRGVHVLKDAAFVVGVMGGDGVAYRYQAGKWEELDLGGHGDRRFLRAVWASTSKEAWFGGGAGLLLHYHEESPSGQVTRLHTGDGHNLHALAPYGEGLFVVGDAGAILYRCKR